MTEDAESNDLNNIRGRGNVSDMFILEPDIGLGDHIKANRISRNSDNSRREESSISFRRFLQNDGQGNRSTHPDLYNCSRQDRSGETASIDSESPDLPDFVQDHLAVEQIYFNDGAQPSSANLPDFASFINATRSENNNESDNHSVDVERRRCRNRVPLDLPMSNFASNNSSNDRSRAGLRLPFDLTTDSSENNIASSGSRLPDFLSDGHIFGPDNALQNDIPSTSSNNHVNVPQDLEERTLVSMLERDNERLREELQVLRSVLMKKDDRIKELEDIVTALEISKLQMQADANTQTVAKTNDNVGRSASKEEIDHPKNSEAEKLEVFSESFHDDNLLKDNRMLNPNLTLKVKEMTNASERLVRELLKIITDFQVNVDKQDSLLKSEQDTPPAVNFGKNADICSSSSSTNSLRPQ